jgi:hypothetical protein
VSAVAKYSPREWDRFEARTARYDDLRMRLFRGYVTRARSIISGAAIHRCASCPMTVIYYVGSVNAPDIIYMSDMRMFVCVEIHLLHRISNWPKRGKSRLWRVRYIQVTLINSHRSQNTPLLNYPTMWLSIFTRCAPSWSNNCIVLTMHLIVSQSQRLYR